MKQIERKECIEGRKLLTCNTCLTDGTKNQIVLEKAKTNVPKDNSDGTNKKVHE